MYLPSSGKNFHNDPAIRFFDFHEVDAKKVQQRNPNGFTYPSKKYRLPLVCSYLVPGFSLLLNKLVHPGEPHVKSRRMLQKNEQPRLRSGNSRVFWGLNSAEAAWEKNVSPRRNTPLKFNMVHLKLSPWKRSCLFWKPSFSPKFIYEHCPWRMLVGRQAFPIGFRELVGG